VKPCGYSGLTRSVGKALRSAPRSGRPTIMKHAGCAIHMIGDECITCHDPETALTILKEQGPD
jgi:hypothetical protein